MQFFFINTIARIITYLVFLFFITTNVIVNSITERTIKQSQRSNSLTKSVTTPQHPSTPTYEEENVDHHSESTVMTTNSAYGLHTPHC